MCEDNVQLQPHSILSPMDSIWHPFVDLVSHPIVQIQAGVNIFGRFKNLVSHPVVQVQHIKAKGSSGERDHQVSLHHIEPDQNNDLSIDNDNNS